MSDVKVSVGAVSQKAIAKGMSGAEMIEVSTEVIFEHSGSQFPYRQSVSTYLLTSSDGKVLPGQFSKDDASNTLMARERELAEDAEDSVLIKKGEWPTTHLFGLKGRSMYDKDQEKIAALQLEKGSLARLLSGTVPIFQLNRPGIGDDPIELTAYAVQDRAFQWLRVPQSSDEAKKYLAALHAVAVQPTPRPRTRNQPPR